MPEDFKFKLKRLPEYSKEAILAEIQRVAALIRTRKMSKMSVAEFQKHARVSETTISSEFGNWTEALRQAGLPDMVCGPAHFKEDEEIIEEMKRVAKKLGKNTLLIKEFNENSKIGPKTMRRHFGSWKIALKEAGLKQSLGRKYSEEECIENLLQVWTHYGRPPKQIEMSLPPSRIGLRSYINKWGTWTKALYAFVERMEKGIDLDDPQKQLNDKEEAKPIEISNLHQKPSEVESMEKGVDIDDPEKRLNDQQEAQPLKNSKHYQKASKSERREISASMRWKVLNRDHFRCSKCGRSPATEHGCKIEVDHIFPFSKGGKTVLENLQTLCDKCNRGKGASLE